MYGHQKECSILNLVLGNMFDFNFEHKICSKLFNNSSSITYFKNGHKARLCYYFVLRCQQTSEGERAEYACRDQTFLDVILSVLLVKQLRYVVFVRHSRVYPNLRIFRNHF